jgi:hypothetical protein
MFHLFTLYFFLKFFRPPFHCKKIGHLTHILLTAFLPLSGDSNIFVHLAAAQGRRLAKFQQHETAFFPSNVIVTSRYRLTYNFSI